MASLKRGLPSITRWESWETGADLLSLPRVSPFTKRQLDEGAKGFGRRGGLEGKSSKLPESLFLWIQ